MSNPPAPSEQDPLTVPVAEELLSVDKRVVETGRGVRIHKTVHAEPVRIDDMLRQDTIDIARVPVDRTLAAGEALPATRYEGDVLIVPVFEEVLVVERRMRLKEELHLTRKQHTTPHTQTVMRRTEQVSIERFDESDKS